MPQEQFYDGAFAELFHHPKFIRSLLFDFIDEEWVRQIDLDSMKIEDGVHKGMGERPLFSDMVISFDFLNKALKVVSGAGSCEPGAKEQHLPGAGGTERKGGAGPGPGKKSAEGKPKDETGSLPDVPQSPTGCSIYLLLEFQSSAESMSLRILEYLARLYRRQESKHLYPVIPIVIYNGIASWSEKPVFEKQFAFIPDSVRPYLPLYRYILIDEERFDEELLRKLKGAVAFFFRIDKVDLKKRDTVAERILEVLREMRRRDPEIHDLLSKYVEGIFSLRGIENEKVEEYIKKRRKPMLAQRVEEMKNQIREEGREEGRAEGYGQGELKGQQKSLIRQLSRKFSLSPEEEQEILSCDDPDRLDEALDVILFADTKEAVLEKLR